MTDETKKDHPKPPLTPAAEEERGGGNKGRPSLRLISSRRETIRGEQESAVRYFARRRIRSLGRLRQALFELKYVDTRDLDLMAEENASLDTAIEEVMDLARVVPHSEPFPALGFEGTEPSTADGLRAPARSAPAAGTLDGRSRSERPWCRPVAALGYLRDAISNLAIETGEEALAGERHSEQDDARHAPSEAILEPVDPSTQ